jgi:hypothetical protein
MAMDAVKCAGIDTTSEWGGRGNELCRLRGGAGLMKVVVATAAVVAALVGSGGSGNHDCGGGCGDNGGSGGWQ